MLPAACETAPLLLQDDELIVGHPCGAPRAGSFSPDIAWKWVRDELDTLSTRSQDPYQVAEEDKEIMREKIFPFWEGRSLDEACEAAFRKAGVWDFSAEAFVSDLTYHHTSGGGDTSPGYDIILFAKGINGIKEEAEQHLADYFERQRRFRDDEIDLDVTRKACAQRMRRLELMAKQFPAQGRTGVSD